MTLSSLSRRKFLQISGSAVSALALAACVPAAAPSAPATDDTAAATGGEAVVSADSPLWVLHSNDFHPDYNDLIRKTIVDYATEKGWAFEVADLRTVAEVAAAIKDMAVRGAGCIGATAAYGMVLAAREAQTPADLAQLAQALTATRPTAVNLAWAVKRQLAAINKVGFDFRVEVTQQAFEPPDIAEMVEPDGLIHVTCEYGSRPYPLTPEAAPASA